MKRTMLVASVLLLGSACSGPSQSPSENMLDLGSAPKEGSINPDSPGGTVTVVIPPLTGQPRAGSATTVDAVLKVGRESVADAQAAFTASSVVAYCRAFATVLVQPQDIQACLRMVLVDPTWREGMPEAQGQAGLFQAAAQLPLLRRFTLCTSDNALRFVASFADYDRCMPRDLDKALDMALGEAMSKAREVAGVGPPAYPYPDPVAHAARLAPEERVAYCGIPEIAGAFEVGEKGACLEGVVEALGPPATEAGGHDAVEIDPYTVLLNASRMRDHGERSAFCSQTNVSSALTHTQRQECVVGLSPQNPGATRSADTDPDYNDEGH